MSIHPPYKVFYQQSIDFCLQSAARSIDLIGELMEAVDSNQSLEPLAEVEPQLVLNELQNIIVQGAAVSRYFWPVRSKYEARGVELRKTYAVLEDSPLKSRELRNAIEHFDERLDEHLEQGIVGVIIPHYLGPTPPPTQVKQHFFRAYFIDTGIFQLLENRFEVDPLAQELWRLAGGAAE
jgi:hypothetical protein